MEEEHSLYPAAFLTWSVIISEKTGKRMGIGNPDHVNFLSRSSQRIKNEQNKHNVLSPLISKEPFTTNQHVDLTSVSKALISLKITIIFSKWFCSLTF